MYHFWGLLVLGSQSGPARARSVWQHHESKGKKKKLSCDAVGRSVDIVRCPLHLLSCDPFTGPLPILFNAGYIQAHLSFLV